MSGNPALAQIRAANPFPWHQEINFNGAGGVRLVDASGREVPMFAMTSLAVLLTTTMAQRAPA